MGIRIHELRFGHMEEGVVVDGADEDGGVYLSGSIENCGSKAIADITLRFKPYDSAGRDVMCMLTDRVTCEMRVDHTILPKKFRYFCSEKPVWYNPSIASMVVAEADIKYEDGTGESLHQSQIPVFNFELPRGGMNDVLY